MRAFTLVELAIVIVIAGILAAVAVPIYQGLVAESKWTEGKTGAGLINHALLTYKAEHSGELPGIGVGWPVALYGPVVGLDAESFREMKYFNDETFWIFGETFNPGELEAGLYRIDVEAAEFGNPLGVYTLYYDGREELFTD